MSKIKIPNYDFLNEVEISKLNMCDEYKKLVAEADLQIEKDRLHYIEVYKNAKNFIVQSYVKKRKMQIVKKVKLSFFDIYNSFI